MQTPGYPSDINNPRNLEHRWTSIPIIADFYAQLYWFPINLEVGCSLQFSSLARNLDLRINFWIHRNDPEIANVYIYIYIIILFASIFHRTTIEVAILGDIFMTCETRVRVASRSRACFLTSPPQGDRHYWHWWCQPGQDQGRWNEMFLDC